VSARNFSATVSYDGTDFSGSQLQPKVRTVQGELEKAARELFGVSTRVALAGRTDAGVHARGQVAAFAAETRMRAESIERALNAILSVDVAVRELREVPTGFDPRRNARRRWYRYLVLQAAPRDPLRQRFSWQVGSPLDVEPMRAASGAIVGTRDFSACSGSLEGGRTFVRSVYRADWSSDSCDLRFDIEANAFLPQMVRRLVGALVRVGRNSLSIEEFARTLDAGTLGELGPVAPPQGLCLEQVRYDEE
jgi:tRNA pseudouridine38-40 synthase